LTMRCDWMPGRKRAVGIVPRWPRLSGPVGGGDGSPATERSRSRGA
jgi:hypothetical protein